MKTKIIGNTKPFTEKEVLKVGDLSYVVVKPYEETIEEEVQYKAVAVLVENDDIEATVKSYKLESIITANGFYGDGMSRVDLLTPIVLMLAASLDRDAIVPVPGWKKESGIEEAVTVGEFLDAIQNSLEQKGSTIGV